MDNGNEHAALCILAKLTKMDDRLSYNILDADAVDPERVDKRMVELDSKPGKCGHDYAPSLIVIDKVRPVAVVYGNFDILVLCVVEKRFKVVYRNLAVFKIGFALRVVAAAVEHGTAET